MAIEVLLRRSVEKLGSVGDVVRVKPGYARNYLFPYGLAVEPTKENLRLVEKDKVVEAARGGRSREAARRADRQARGPLGQDRGEEQPRGAPLRLRRPQAGRRRARRDGLPDDRRGAHVRMEHVKELGEYEVKIHFSAEAETIAKLWVLDDVTKLSTKKSPEEQAAAAARAERAAARAEKAEADGAEGGRGSEGREGAEGRQEEQVVPEVAPRVASRRRSRSPDGRSSTGAPRCRRMRREGGRACRRVPPCAIAPPIARGVGGARDDGAAPALRLVPIRRIQVLRGCAMGAISHLPSYGYDRSSENFRGRPVDDAPVGPASPICRNSRDRNDLRTSEASVPRGRVA